MADAAQSKKHGIKIDGTFTVTATGISNVRGVSDREAILDSDCGTLTVKGKNLNLQKLDTEQGTVVIASDGISSLSYGGGSKEKFSFKNLFK